jgi:hypothetical protein
MLKLANYLQKILTELYFRIVPSSAKFLNNYGQPSSKTRYQQMTSSFQSLCHFTTWLSCRKSKQISKDQRSNCKNKWQTRECKMRNQISERVIDFVANVLKMVGDLPPKTIASKLSDQLIRSSTSVEANYEEAQAAQSRKDFVHKLQISLKEM